MPELPEVETSRRGIEPYCLGKKITGVTVRESRLRWPVDKAISQKVTSQTISQVARRGKYLLLKAESWIIMIHLGMSGSLRIVSQDEVAGKHDHVDIQLCSGKCLRFNDPRRFGSILLTKVNEEHSLLAKLGVEPLSKEFNLDYLWQICQKRSAPIKSVIMNGQVVVGVGNIYAQESLFRVGITPSRAANKISKKRLASLVDEIKLVLTEAIEAGGSSLKDFTKADGKPGYFQHTFKVYGKAGEQCPVCSTPLKHTVIAQRATVYCAKCQK
ncbi:bifunctional DNA-formamidopyrimidine glycosylase/DNA-(apurinic or apyrimidinic site) lyase [Aliikangiella sp. G2MR2-5]|uniref:bifunctional DNA-formamidopyrimidine glycosylase/DNA-(apurinic or apyrimidinic site) lyase n=1 Tax=Aliikangiella sp. G2MR2-5 TaxID=2788943 RepID=UPI0018A9258B